MSRVVITGVTGLVGGGLASAFSSRHEVIGICRNPMSGVPFAPVAIDLAREWSASSLPENVDIVIHAAQSDKWQAPDGVLDVFGVNLASTVRLLDYAVRAGALHFVLMSTGGLYGSAETPLTESSPLRIADGPLRYYFETKQSAEGFAALYRDRMAVSVLRPFFIYGPGQRVPKLVPRLIETIKLGQPVQLRGESGTRLNPVHLDDVVALVEACVESRHTGVVNVAGGQATTIRAMTERIAKVIGAVPRFEAVQGDPEHYVADTSAMRSLVGRGLIGFDEGIASLLTAAHTS